MRIAVIGGRDFQQFPTISYGGIETSVENLAWGLHQAGKDFFCIVPRRETVQTYPFEVIESEVPPLCGPESNVWPFAKSLPAIVKRTKPDVIWSQGFWSAETLKDLGIPIICTFQEFVPDQRRKHIWFTHRENTWYRFISKSQFNEWVDTADDRLRKRSFHLHTGLADEEFDFGRADEREDYYLWVGGLNWGWHTKGLDLFIELARRHPGKRFIAYGTGNKKIETELDRLSHSIASFEFRGMLKRGEPHKKAFARARLFLMPTQMHEPLGRTVIESMSKGTPVLGSTNGALPELIEPGVSGFTADHIEMYERYLEHPYDYKACFEYSKRFHINVEIEALIAKSEEIIGERCNTNVATGKPKKIFRPTNTGEQSMSLDAILSEAMTCHRSGDLDGAERLYNDLLFREPADPDALNLLGVLNLQRHRLAEAEQFIRKAISIDPAISEFHQNLIEVFKHQGNNHPELDCYRYIYQHSPMYRFQAVQAVLDHLQGQTYLEIGIDAGQSFGRIRAPRKFGVDPKPTYGLIDKIAKAAPIEKFAYTMDDAGNPSQILLSGNSGGSLAGTSRNELYYMTSDQFFAEQAPNHFADSGVDVSFVDGLHTYHQTYRDVQNVLKFLNKGGVILMHDCNPPTETSAIAAMSLDEVKAMNIPGWDHQWCGDVWKTVVRLRSNHPDLRVFVLNCDFGIGVVSKGTPEGMLNYTESEIENLSFSELERNRKEILNLKPQEYLYDFLKTFPR